MEIAARHRHVRAVGEMGEQRRAVAEAIGDDVDDLALALQLPVALDQARRS